MLLDIPFIYYDGFFVSSLVTEFLFHLHQFINDTFCPFLKMKSKQIFRGLLWNKMELSFISTAFIYDIILTL